MSKKKLKFALSFEFGNFHQINKLKYVCIVRVLHEGCIHYIPSGRYIREHSLRGARGARGANFFLAARVFDVPRNALKRPR